MRRKLHSNIVTTRSLDDRFETPANPRSPAVDHAGLDRRQILGTGVGLLGLSLAGSVWAQSAPARQAASSNQQTQEEPQRPPAIESDTVRTFVGASHGKIDVVRAALEEEPTLVNAVWDWGGGDFESALGAASHVGYRDMAQLLIAKGARFDLFAAVMLGQLAVVRAVIDDWPDLIHVRGPHGLDLFHHARKGGEEAEPVLDYLQAKAAAA